LKNDAKQTEGCLVGDKNGVSCVPLPIPNAKAKTPIPIIESRVVPDSIVYTGSFTSYDVLVVSSFHHRRIDHGKGFAGGEENKRHINGTLKLLEPGKTASTQIQRHPAQALLLLPRGNANGASTEGTTKSFTASCWAGPGGRGWLGRLGPFLNRTLPTGGLKTNGANARAGFPFASSGSTPIIRAPNKRAWGAGARS